MALPPALPSGSAMTISLNAFEQKTMRKTVQANPGSVQMKLRRVPNTGNRNLISHSNLGVKDCHKFSGLDLLYLTWPHLHLQWSGKPGQLGKTTGGSCDPKHSS